MFCFGSEWKSPAGKRYLQRMAVATVLYVLVTMCTAHYVRHHHPQGALLYLMASLPSLPIFGILVAVGLYLHEIRDEYQRMLLVRSTLFGTGTVLAVGAFTDLLRAYSDFHGLPPFTEFNIFWGVFALTQAIQSWLGRRGMEESDE